MGKIFGNRQNQAEVIQEQIDTITTVFKHILLNLEQQTQMQKITFEKLHKTPYVHKSEFFDEGDEE